jgi:indolepyruvate ferredoxin oxidoreductase
MSRRTHFRYNLAPPILASSTARGRPRKWGIPRLWLFPALSLLARAKRLRGSAFDLFGYSQERRDERALIHQYETLTQDVLGQLTPDNLAAAVELLSLVGTVRGFGPVKNQALRAYLTTVEGRWQTFAAG